MSDEMTIPADRLEGPALLSPRRWLRILGVNAAGAVMVTLLLTVLGSRWSFGANLLASLIYANAIGIPAALLLPPLVRRLARDRPTLLWPGLLVSLLLLATVGSLLASLIVMALGVVPPAELWAAWSFGVRIAVVVTLGIGVSMYLYETTRAKLDQATLELTRKELERERAEKLATEVRLASLEARLHPHFLFNTLNAISGLITEDPDRAKRLVGRLAGLLRYSLDRHQRLVPLAEELAFVRGYLEIQAARFEARLRYRIEVPRDAEAVLVPPLALQTLVENSVTHVAEARREGAEIRIEGSRLDDRLILRVWDDGPGFTLEEVPAGHGLDTLRVRLAALYGAEARLEVARENTGMCVALSLPARRLGEASR